MQASIGESPLMNETIRYIKAVVKFVVARAYRGFPRYDAAPSLGATLASDIRFLIQVKKLWS